MLLSQLANGMISCLNHVIEFLGFNPATLSKTSFVSTKSLALRDEEELRRLILPISPPQAFPLTQPKEIEDSVLKNGLDVVVDNEE